MAETVDRPNVVIPPPIAWALAILAGLGVGWLYPLQFVPTSIPRAWVGVGVFALGLALAIWAIVTIRRAGTQFDINKPTTAIVENGPYRLTRNPIYLGMFLGLTAIAIGFDNLWVLAMQAEILGLANGSGMRSRFRSMTASWMARSRALMSVNVWWAR